MKHMRFFFLFSLILAAMFGCARQEPGEQFLGAWLNRTEHSKGTILIEIQRDNNNFLVRKTFTDNGTPFEVNSAKLENGYLVLDEGLFKKITFSEQDNALVVLDHAPLAPFRKVTGSAPTKNSASKNATAEYSASDVALAVTGYLGENVGKYCDVKVAPFCGQSMEATVDGFRLRAKTIRSIKSILLTKDILPPTCSLLEAAKAKLPTKLTFEVFSDQEAQVMRIEGICKPY